MKKILLTITILINAGAINAQSGWFTQPTGTDITLRSVYMTDNNTGYCVGGDILIDDGRAVDRGIILKTTNGGVNWTIQSPPNFDRILHAVIFPNDATGYAVGRDGFAFAIYKTTNSGMNWIQQEPPPATNTPPLYGMHFFDTETGMAVGNGGMIFRTSNGGANWTTQGFPNQSALYSVTFTSPSTGYIGADNSIYKTTNGGANWNVSLNSFGTAFQSVYFLNENTGHAAGGNKIFKTTNAGVNWSSIEIQGNIFTSIYFPSVTTGYCAGEMTAIYRTTDAGSSWVMQTQPGGTPLYSVFFTNDTMGYAVGNVGIMLRTTTGGTVGVTVISGEVPEDFRLYQNYPNPFNPETIINYEVRERTNVNLSIYDVRGRLITEAVNGVQSAGVYRYNFNGDVMPGGVYFYRLTAGSYTAVKKMILLK